MKRQNIRIDNPQAVRRLIQRCINDLMNDEMKTDKARCIGYLGQIMLNAMQTEDLEKRIKELESRMD